MEPLNITIEDAAFEGVTTVSRDEFTDGLMRLEQEIGRTHGLRGVLRLEILKALREGRLDEGDETISRWVTMYTTWLILRRFPVR